MPDQARCDLHFSAFLFPWGADISPIYGVTPGLTLIGYVLALCPLSYGNRRFTARMWDLQSKA